MDNWNELVNKVAEIVSSREGYYRKLGELSWQIGNKYGPSALKDFAEDVKETHGVTVSHRSLENYRFVFDKVRELDLPEDLSYRTLQYIATSGKPDYWAQRIHNEGLSSPEVYRLMREEKGLNKEKLCPNCGYNYAQKETQIS